MFKKIGQKVEPPGRLDPRFAPPTRTTYVMDPLTITGSRPFPWLLLAAGAVILVLMGGKRVLRRR